MAAEGLTVLLAEDDHLSKQLLTSYLERNDHKVIGAANGREAIETFARHTVDLIILDVMMPEMDGMEACRQLKHQMRDRWVPIMMISSNSEEQDQVMGIDVGADYYLTKPISFPILRAKLKASQRIASLHRELEKRNHELSAYYRRNQAENELAKQMIERIIQSSTSSDTRIHQSVQSVDQFSGDVVSIVNAFTGSTYALVADATGHGLPAAITLMPAMEIFYQMSRRGYGVSSIAREMNRRLRDRLPASHFLAASVIQINPQRHSLAIWNGACPTAYVVSRSQEIRDTLPSAHPPLGVLDDQDFDDTVQLSTVSEQDRIVACTDGIVEARNPTGELFGSHRLVQLIETATPEQALMPRIIDELSKFRGSGAQDDDQSILVLTVEAPMELPVNEFVSDRKSHQPDSVDARPLDGWDVRLELRGQDIHRTEVVPTVNQVLENLRLPEVWRNKAFLVLTELINNAVDHGVLHLESTPKKHSGDFEEYIQRREELLNRIDNGFIRILASRGYDNGRNVLRLMVMDSGQGFNTASYTDLTDCADCGSDPYGRGLRVVAGMVDRLRFLDNGSSVEVEFILDRYVDDKSETTATSAY